VHLRHYNAGISLVEVMVAVAVLGSGLLGLGALQAKGLAAAHSAYYRTIAADLAADLGDRIRANRSPFIVMEGGLQHADYAAVLPPDFARCAQQAGNLDAVNCQAQLNNRQAYRVAAEMAEWNTALRRQLPGATFALQSAAASAVPNHPAQNLLRYTLTITWVDDRKADNPNFNFVTVIE